MTKIFSGKNPSQIYMDAMFSLMREGDKCAPRGKEIKELRPVILEYQNPKSRVTFLKGRVINPFFQIAEALWILAGRSDVQWLLDYNKNMGQFSDDGVYFNAPYGERLRFWNKSDAHGFLFNPIDQLHDVYQKIVADKDTRQAVAVIYNPLFDNANIETVDRPCNLILTFKLRNGKLDLNVFNRSNDLHWGTFGANLCQFSTILEVMASWLGVEVGTYYQTTDSLHIYLDDYGSRETDKILSAYNLLDHDVNIESSDIPEVHQFLFENEPRFGSNFEEFNDRLSYYFNTVDPLLRNQIVYSEKGSETWDTLKRELLMCKDEYLRMSYMIMAAYQAHKYGSFGLMVDALRNVNDCSWRVSCLRFLSKRYKDLQEFRMLYDHYPQEIKDYIERKGE